MLDFNSIFEALTNPSGEFLSKQHVVVGDHKTVKSCTKPGLHSMQKLLFELPLGLVAGPVNMNDNRDDLIAKITALAVQFDNDELKKDFVLKVTSNATFFKACSEPAKQWLQDCRDYEEEDDDDSEEEDDDKKVVVNDKAQLIDSYRRRFQGGEMDAAGAALLKAAMADLRRQAPPDGQAYVYVLGLPTDCIMGKPNRLVAYVGETEHLAQRMAQHRDDHGDDQTKYKQPYFIGAVAVPTKECASAYEGPLKKYAQDQYVANDQRKTRKRLEAFMELKKRVVYGYMSDGKYPKLVLPWLARIDLKVAIERFSDFAVRLGRITAVLLIQRRWVQYRDRVVVYYKPSDLLMLMSARAKKNWQKLVNHTCMMSAEPLFLFHMLRVQLEARRLAATPAAMGK